MSKKTELEQLQQSIKDATVQFNIDGFDNGTIIQFAENLFDQNQTLAQHIISGDIEKVEFQNLLSDLASNVAFAESSMESTEPHWDVEDGIEPHWGEDEDDNL
jgi:hypothetical protein